MKLNKNSTIGIWGFGVTGRSIAHYFCEQEYTVHIMDQRKPTEEEQSFLHKKNSIWYAQETESDLFFNSCDFIFSSPGININHMRYATHKDKFITELDYFSFTFLKPIIAITGSVGKTSTTSILATLFDQLSIPIAMGGNIGTPTFDLITQQNTVDYALLEVSSFQLMHCTNFAPTIAVWTNFYPNHLDYHQTEDEYFLAKYKILEQQSSHTFQTFSVIPLSLREKIPTPPKDHTRAYFAPYEPDLNVLFLHDNELLYYTKKNMILCYARGIDIPLMPLTYEMHALSFIENIIIICAICDAMNLNKEIIQQVATLAHLPAHRLENIGTFNTITFYNDSKATTTASTLAAVQKLKDKPLHLFLGGLSKGVDRAPFVAQLKNNVKHIYCFGKEASELYKMCKNNGIPAMHFATLNDALAACINQIESRDCVLLSPAGSSYDLYENYEVRGNHFKELVEKYIKAP